MQAEGESGGISRHVTNLGTISNGWLGTSSGRFTPKQITLLVSDA